MRYTTTAPLALGTSTVALVASISLYHTRKLTRGQAKTLLNLNPCRDYGANGLQELRGIFACIDDTSSGCGASEVASDEVVKLWDSFLAGLLSTRILRLRLKVFITLGCLKGQARDTTFHDLNYCFSAASFEAIPSVPRSTYVGLRRHYRSFEVVESLQFCIKLNTDVKSTRFNACRNRNIVETPTAAILRAPPKLTKEISIILELLGNLRD